MVVFSYIIMHSTKQYFNILCKSTYSAPVALTLFVLGASLTAPSFVSNTSSLFCIGASTGRLLVAASSILNNLELIVGSCEESPSSLSRDEEIAASPLLLLSPMLSLSSNGGAGKSISGSVLRLLSIFTCLVEC